MTTFVVGPGITRLMTADATTPASDELYVTGKGPDVQWSQAMGENGTQYRWLKLTSRVYRYPEGRAPSSLAAKLQRVIDLGRSKIWRPYSGPIVKQPESFRWGDPGYDCSSFVSIMYRDTLGTALTMFTDAIANETNRIDVPQALPGDIILYRYYDKYQSGVAFLHTGLWLGGGRMLDCQYPDGLREHKPLAHPFEIHRARGL